jgi:hypothetical protein
VLQKLVTCLGKHMGKGTHVMTVHDLTDILDQSVVWAAGRPGFLWFDADSRTAGAVA